MINFARLFVFTNMYQFVFKFIGYLIVMGQIYPGNDPKITRI